MVVRWESSRLLTATRRESPCIPMVVIGALKVGGSGKTSMTMALAQKAIKEGLNVAILTYRIGGKGERRTKKNLDEVMPGATWRETSDEACMLRQLSGARVFSTRNRAQAWQELQDPEVFGKHPFDLILSDDGFQDPRLQNAFRILLMGTEENPRFRDLLPGGRFRETEAGQQRADLILRGPSARKSDKKNAKTEFQNANAQFQFLRMLQFPEKFQIGLPCVAVCALGNPQGFFADLASGGVELKSTYCGLNHRGFVKRDIERFLGQYPEHDILCTRKDWVKLKEQDIVPPRLVVVDQQLDFSPVVWNSIEQYRNSFRGVKEGNLVH